jgi:hypothetical protein
MQNAFRDVTAIPLLYAACSGRRTASDLILKYRTASATHDLAPLPTRLRTWFAVAAIFLGLIAQTHPISLSKSLTTNTHALAVSSNGNPDFCPLCVAMHSSRPAQAGGAVVLAIVTSRVLLPPKQQFQTFRPEYSLYIRPPPYSSR